MKDDDDDYAPVRTQHVNLSEMKSPDFPMKTMSFGREIPTSLRKPQILSDSKSANISQNSNEMIDSIDLEQLRAQLQTI